MRIDFSKITGLSDQRGKIVQIADISGGVLWSANVPKPHEHKKGEPVLVREPTCTKPAEYAVYCADCGAEVDRYEDDGVFAEHIPDGGRVTKAPTCDKTGAYTYYCRECGTWVKADTIPALGHTWGDPYYSSEFSSGYGQKCSVCGELAELAFVECEHPASAYHEAVITAPTCTGLGSKTCSCDVCRTSWAVSIPALGHSYTGEEIEPTCTEKGFTKYTCSRCGHSYTDNEKDPNGHNFVAGWVVTKAATCTENGTETRTCLTCGHKETRPLHAPGHSYTSKVTAPTCTAKGYTTHTCVVCGHNYTDTETAALGHSPGSPVCVRDATCTVAPEYAVYCTRCGVEVDRYEDDGGLLEHIADGGRVTTAPTCVATGIRKYYCRECSTWVKDETIPATGIHTYKDVITPPTCTAGGYTTHTCTVCGHSYTDGETDPNGHNFAAGWVVTKAVTCTTPGTARRTCLTCGYYEERTLAAPGHSYTSKVTAPTCTAKGYTTHTCVVCGHNYTDTETAALGHSPGSPVCVRDATCTVAPEYAVYCTRCGVEVDRYEDDGGLLEHIADGGRVTTAPTCVATGIRKYYCRECDTWLRDEVIPATGIHTYTDTVTPPTCTEGGHTTHTCTVCGHSCTDSETDPNGHNFVAGWLPDVAPTCTTGGTEKRICLSCGHTETRKVKALGHDYRYDYTEDATCEEGGYDVYTCTRCSDWYTANDTEPNGHNFVGGWEEDEAPTCTTGGTEKRTCLACGHTETRSVDALGHDWEYYPDPIVSSGQSRQCRRCELIEEDA